MDKLLNDLNDANKFESFDRVREVRLRVWIKSLKIMIYQENFFKETSIGSLVINFHKFGTTAELYKEGELISDVTDIQIIPSLGVFDTNNKPIYEGDVLSVYGEWHVGLDGSVYEGDKYNLVATKNQGTIELINHVNGCHYKDFPDFNIYHVAKVVGNIYENEEYLKLL